MKTRQKIAFKKKEKMGAQKACQTCNNDCEEEEEEIAPEPPRGLWCSLAAWLKEEAEKRIEDEVEHFSKPSAEILKLEEKLKQKTKRHETRAKKSKKTLETLRRSPEDREKITSRYLVEWGERLRAYIVVVILIVTVVGITKHVLDFPSSDAKPKCSSAPNTEPNIPEGLFDHEKFLREPCDGIPGPESSSGPSAAKTAYEETLDSDLKKMRKKYDDLMEDRTAGIRAYEQLIETLSQEIVSLREELQNFENIQEPWKGVVELARSEEFQNSPDLKQTYQMIQKSLQTMTPNTTYQHMEIFKMYVHGAYNLLPNTNDTILNAVTLMTYIPFVIMLGAFAATHGPMMLFYSALEQSPTHAISCMVIGVIVIRMGYQILSFLYDIIAAQRAVVPAATPAQE